MLRLWFDCIVMFSRVLCHFMCSVFSVLTSVIVIGSCNFVVILCIFDSHFLKIFTRRAYVYFGLLLNFPTAFIYIQIVRRPFHIAFIFVHNYMYTYVCMFEYDVRLWLYCSDHSLHYSVWCSIRLTSWDLSSSIEK